MKKIAELKQLFLIAVLLISFVFGAVMFIQYKDVSNELALYKENPTAAEALQIIEKISSLIELPSDETPEISTITDAQSLHADAFFKLAENGDKVLTYSEKKILYRPSTNKVIETQNTYVLSAQVVNESTLSVELLDLVEDTPEVLEEETVQITEPIEIALVNGTKSYAGLTNKAEIFMQNRIETFPFTVKHRVDSVGEYQRSILIVNTELPQQVIDKISDTFNATVSPLPEGEKPLQADLIIILGTAFVDSNANELGY